MQTFLQDSVADDSFAEILRDIMLHSVNNLETVITELTNVLVECQVAKILISGRRRKRKEDPNDASFIQSGRVLYVVSSSQLFLCRSDEFAS